VAPQDFAIPKDVDSGAPERPSLLSILRRRWLIVVIVPLLTGAAAAAFALANERQYESEAKLLFNLTIGTNLNAIGLNPTAPDADHLANSNVEVVGSRDVAAATSDELGQQGLDLSTDDVEDDVTVSAQKDNDVVSIRARADSAEDARQLATVYSANAVEIARTRQERQAVVALRSARQSLKDLPRGQVELAAPALQEIITKLRALRDGGVTSPQIVQSGFLPTSKAGTPVRTILLGVLFGLVLGVGLALLRDQADRRLHRAEDVSAAFDARVLTTVPRSRKLKRNVAFDQLPPKVTEAFRMLVANLRFSPGARARTVLITSSRSREGKSTIAWYLAAAAARGGMRVALVEADLRRPSMAESHGLNPVPGLAETLGGKVWVSSALQTAGWGEDGGSAAEGLQSPSVLVAGRPTGDSWVLMQSGVMERVLEVLAAENDLVLIDTPPIPYVADAVSLLQRVDGVIVVASVNSTKGPEAARLRDQLATFDARILGVVANGGSAVGGYAYTPSSLPEFHNGGPSGARDGQTVSDPDRTA
jgi:polysaccharide biosynthesis transport protein